MFNKSNSVKLLEKIVKLDTVEFLGICKILDIKLYKQEKAPKHDSEGNNGKVELVVRDFTEIWGDLCDKIENLNRIRRRNLTRLVDAATKKGD